ncbi:MAG TPA: hypothetical protein VLH56_05965 [Dissulfurispiraceae bacterium]|nr:hypothetical protein [Dissulfurispiraceae bacterium]
MRQSAPNAYSPDEIEAKQRQVGNVFIVERFVPEVGVNETEPPERASAERIHIERRNENTARITDNNMRDAAFARYKNPDLPPDFFGNGGQITTELMSNDCIGRNTAPVCFFEQGDGAFSEA